MSVKVFEWLVILGGSKIYGKKEFEARESKNSLVGWWSLKFIKLKWPRRKVCLISLDNLSRRVLRWFLLKSEMSILGYL